MPPRALVPVVPVVPVAPRDSKGVPDGCDLEGVQSHRAAEIAPRVSPPPPVRRYAQGAEFNWFWVLN